MALHGTMYVRAKAACVWPVSHVSIIMIIDEVFNSRPFKTNPFTYSYFHVASNYFDFKLIKPAWYEGKTPLTDI